MVVFIAAVLFSSPMAGRFVYSEAAKSRGVLTAFDMMLLDTIMEGIECLASRLGATPSVILFVMPTLSVLLDRLKTRGQIGDEYLNEDVLLDLRSRHEELARLYMDMGFEIVVVDQVLSPTCYVTFEAEFLHYLRCINMAHKLWMCILFVAFGLGSVMRRLRATGSARS